MTALVLIGVVIAYLGVGLVVTGVIFACFVIGDRCARRRQWAEDDLQYRMWQDFQAAVDLEDQTAEEQIMREEEEYRHYMYEQEEEKDRAHKHEDEDEDEEWRHGEGEEHEHEEQRRQEEYEYEERMRQEECEHEERMRRERRDHEERVRQEDDDYWQLIIHGNLESPNYQDVPQAEH